MAQRVNPTARRVRWRRWLLAGVIFCALLVGLSGWYLTRPAQLRTLSEHLLETYTGGVARVGDARLDWRGAVVLEDVGLSVPGLAEPAAKLFEARRVHVTLDAVGLLRGGLGMEAVRLEQPTLHLTELAETGQFNHQHLPARPPTDRDRLADLRLPTMWLIDARVRFSRWDTGELEVTEMLRLAGQLQPVHTQPRTYRFALRQRLADGSAGPRLQGTLDPIDQRVVAELDRFAFADRQRSLLPTSLRRWWDRLDPDGEVPRVRVQYDPEVGVTAQMDVRDVAINLPVRDWPTRLTDVTGRLTLEHETLRIDELSGRLGEVRYHVEGVVEGFDAEAPLDVVLRTDPFEVGEDADLHALLPEELAERYRRFSPAGRFQGHTRLRREAPGAELEYSGELNILDAQGSYHRFDYPLREVQGHVRFDTEQVLVRMRGRGIHGGAVDIDGTVAPPGRGGALDFRIRVEDGPVGELLFEALEPQHRRVVETLMDQEAYDRLVQKGVIAPTAQYDELAGSGTAVDLEATISGAEAEAQPPTFALDGTVDGEVRIERSLEQERATATVTLGSRNLNLLFTHWPYPLTVTDGQVTITRNRTRVDAVHVKSPTGGGGVVTGEFSRPHEDAEFAPDLQLSDVRLPVDELLLASIPEPQDQWLRRMHLDAVAKGQGRIFRDVDGEIDFAVAFDLDDAAAEPFGAGVRLERMGGRVDLRRGAVALEEVVGAYDDGRVRAEGEVDWRGDERRVALRLDGESLPIDARVLEMVAAEHGNVPQLDLLFATYAPAGAFDVTLWVRDDNRRQAADDPDEEVPDDAFAYDEGAGLHYACVLRPRTLSFDLHGQRIELEDMAGRAIVGDGYVELEQLRGHWPAGSATVTGRVDFGSTPRAALRLDAEAHGLDGLPRALLPAQARPALDALAIDGTARFEDMRFEWNPDPEVDDGEARRFALEGTVALENVAAELGVPVSEVAGELAVRYVQPLDEDARPSAEFDLRARQLRVFDRLVAPARVRVSETDTPGSPRTWQVRTLEGAIYDGVVTGDGEFEIHPEGRYWLDLTMQDVRLGALLETPDKPASDDEGSRDDLDAGDLPPGTLDAALTLEGAYADDADRRGRGEIRVRDARLFNRPLDMAMLQAANFALPLAGGFEHAEVSYLIEGQTVHLERVRLGSPMLTLVGGGTMRLPGQVLDLTLFARNPAGDAFGPFAEMFNLIRDELMCIRVTGTLDSPEARVVTLEGTRDAWQRVFR